MKSLATKPVFWAGIAGLTFAYFFAKGSSGGAGNGFEIALPIAAAGAGMAAIIYATK